MESEYFCGEVVEQITQLPCLTQLCISGIVVNMIVVDYPTTQPYPDVYLDSRVYLEKQTIHQSADLE